jgi:hypothetical protein
MMGWQYPRQSSDLFYLNHSTTGNSQLSHPILPDHILVQFDLARSSIRIMVYLVWASERPYTGTVPAELVCAVYR